MSNSCLLGPWPSSTTFNLGIAFFSGLALDLDFSIGGVAPADADAELDLPALPENMPELLALLRSSS